MQAVILDKEHFPRDKYCGDAVCTPALRILEDMGVMDVLRDANECHYADAGGFVSPSGLSYIGAQSYTVADGLRHLCCARVIWHAMSRSSDDSHARNLRLGAEAHSTAINPP